MAITININGTITFDESLGSQVGGVPAGDEDNNDNDVTLATLQSDASAFYNRLFTAGGLNLPTTFANSFSLAKSADGYITLTGTGSIISLGFTTTAGAALPVYLGADPGAACNLTALDGGAIVLFSDPVLGNRVVYGVDTDGDIVFALFMDPNAGLTSARVWIVQFEPLDNTNPNNDDDVLAMSGLGVGAGVSTAFNFNALPSGQNLFGTVGSTTSGLIVFGKTPALNADGTFTNASNTINTSQGGGPTTIGVNNQMFDPGDGAYFTFIKNPVSNFLAGAPGGLDQNEADDADNMQYTGGTLESDGGFVLISQTQGNALASMTIEAFNIAGSPQGQALVAARGTGHVNLGQIKVYNAAGTLIENSAVGGVQDPNVTISFSGGIATVTGLAAGYKVEFLTGNAAVKFDQVLITGTGGKFDIGGFGVNEPTAVAVPLTGVNFEDDGPTVDLVLDGDAELVVDETTLPASDSITAADLFSTNTADFGTDGEGTDGSVYKLTLGNPSSGLFDTETGNEVILSINAAGTLITGEVDDGGTDVTVFTIAIDPDTGEVTLTQERAMVNGDADDPDEEDTPLTLAADTVGVERSLTDGDDDSASDEVDISAIFKFEDDGPSLPPASQAELELRTDDTDITDSATLSTDDIFPGTPDFGSDGPNAIDPIVYELKLSADNAVSGLVDTATGKAILLKKVGDDIVGYVDEDGSGVIEVGETLEAIRYSLSVPDPLDLDTEDVTFTQSRAVVHDDTSDSSEATSPETVNPNTVTLEQTAIDGDGDVSDVVSFDLGAVTFIEDDGPAIGPIPDGLVDLALNDSVTKSLFGVVGKDPNSSPYILTNFTASINVGGVDVHGVLANDAKSVTYWADTNGDTIFGNAGDTQYYKLELGDQAGAGNYTFTVLIDPPPALTEFDFADLPSGQNLFGAIAQDKSNLDGLALFVIAKNADVNDPGDGQMTNSSATVNTSKGGGPVTIGNTNQMIDPGEGNYFAYLSNADTAMIAGVPGGLTQGSADDADTIGFEGTLTATTAQVEIVQVQGGGLAAMNIKAYDIDMVANYGADGVTTDAEARDFAESPLLAGDDPVNVTGVKVYNGSGVLLESWADTNLDGTYELQDIPGNDNHPQVNVQFFETSAGSGIYYARVSGVNDDYKIEFTTETPHDLALVEGFSGKFDIGGFNIIERQDIPDQLLSFTAKVTDGDGDNASDSWNIGIDGTGIHDDDDVAGVSII